MEPKTGIIFSIAGHEVVEVDKGVNSEISTLFDSNRASKYLPHFRRFPLHREQLKSSDLLSSPSGH